MPQVVPAEMPEAGIREQPVPCFVHVIEHPAHRRGKDQRSGRCVRRLFMPLFQHVHRRAVQRQRLRSLRLRAVCIDVQRPVRKIDIPPAQRDQSPPPHAGIQRDKRHGLKRVGKSAAHRLRVNTWDGPRAHSRVARPQRLFKHGDLLLR